MAKGNVFILSSPSGAGKSSLIKAIRERHLNIQMSVSHTTRAPRPGEEDGVHYHFVDKSMFQAEIERGVFFEWAEVFGNFYGTSKDAVLDMVNQGLDVFLDIDWQGAQQVRKLMPEVKSIFILPPSKEELERRLIGRGQDSAEVIANRMAQAQSEMAHFDEFDFLIINDDFQQALTELEHIVLGQRLAAANQMVKHQSLIKSLLAND